MSGGLLLSAARANEQVLKSFTSADGASYPLGGLIQDANGVLYGATPGSPVDGGTVFAINPDGTGFKVLHHFGSSANDATNPAAPLMLGLDGAIYGTSSGGSNGAGAIFTLRPDGSGYKVLYSFGSVLQDGAMPQPPLVQSADGTLYGATSSGGTTNMGTVFALAPDGTRSRLLHSFRGPPGDGSDPGAGLIRGKDGALYGTTMLGGTNTTHFWGSVFRLNIDGSGFELLHSFGGDNGVNPRGVLYQGSDGALYGAAGIVFRLNPDGSGYRALSTTPGGSVILGTDGTLYGSVVVNGSVNSEGIIFGVNPDGTHYTVVHSFGSFTGDGALPNGPLLLGIDGAFYGTTDGGGSSRMGTVFRLTTALSPWPVLSIVSAAGAGVHIRFPGQLGSNYALYSSTNLSDWSQQGTVSNETGMVEFLDWNIARFSQRFYRAKVVP